MICAPYGLPVHNLCHGTLVTLGAIAVRARGVFAIVGLLPASRRFDSSAYAALNFDFTGCHSVVTYRFQFIFKRRSLGVSAQNASLVPLPAGPHAGEKVVIYNSLTYDK